MRNLAWSYVKIVEGLVNYIASSDKIFSAGRPLIKIDEQISKQIINIWWINSP